VTLAPFDLFVVVEAARLATEHRGLDRLRINDGCAGAGSPACLASDEAAQSTQHPIKEAETAPSVKVVAHGLPGGQVSRDFAPLAAGFDEVEDGIDDFA